MRVLTSAALAALILSGPALASERGGGHRPSPPPGPCGGCRPPVNTNVNVNVNADSHASASARSYINARTYSSSTARGYVGGGTVIYGGGYAGDHGYGGAWGVGGGYVHVDDRDLVTAPPSAPFGYVVQGFGRDYRTGGPHVRRDDRYGREGRWRDERRDAASDHYERWERSETYRRETEAAWETEITGRESRAYDRGYSDGRADCDCRAPEPRPEPRYDPGHGVPYYGDLPPPDAPPVGPPPRHGYRQEPGERG